jgi:hypothetical protein
VLYIIMLRGGYGVGTVTMADVTVAYVTVGDMILPHEPTVGGMILPHEPAVAGMNVDFDVTMAGVIVDFDVSVGGRYAEGDTILHSGFAEGDTILHSGFAEDVIILRSSYAFSISFFPDAVQSRATCGTTRSRTCRMSSIVHRGCRLLPAFVSCFVPTKNTSPNCSQPRLCQGGSYLPRGVEGKG